MDREFGTVCVAHPTRLDAGPDPYHIKLQGITVDNGDSHLLKHNVTTFNR